MLFLRKGGTFLVLVWFLGLVVRIPIERNETSLVSFATCVYLNSWSLFLSVSSQTLTILTIWAVVLWKPWSRALIRMAAPHRELGLRPCSIQSWRIRFKSRLAVNSTCGCCCPNSNEEQKRRMNTHGSINGRSLCRNFTSFRKHPPKVYKFIY